MPRRTSMRRRGGMRRRRGQRGAGFMSFLKKANAWLRKSKIISKVGRALGEAGIPYASDIGSVAGKLGYGRRRGGALKLAGSGRRRYSRR